MLEDFLFVDGTVDVGRGNMEGRRKKEGKQRGKYMEVKEN